MEIVHLWGLLCKALLDTVRLATVLWSILKGLKAGVGWLGRKIAEKINDPWCLSTGDIARELGCEPWQVRRLCESKRFPEPRRIGGRRVFRRSDVPKLREALRAAGYLAA